MLTAPITVFPLSTQEEIEAAAWLSELLTTNDMEVALSELERIGAYDPDVVCLSWYFKNTRTYQIRGSRL